MPVQPFTEMTLYSETHGTTSLNEILIKFNALKARDKIQILWDAIDVMQQYNGRTKKQCVAIAMGYEETENGWMQKG